jgi:hypothetical protein
MKAPASRLRTLLGAALTLAVLAVAAGCQALVNGDVPQYTCTENVPGACPAGSYCKGTGCVPCEPRDICGDGYDNDCNGKVDDGDLNDKDKDGFTFCGRIDSSSGRLANVDCDDDDPAVFPGAKEVCNGKDDDCDGKVDNGVCPDGQTCVPKTGQCISSTAACTVTNCAPPLVCDPQTQQCVKPNSVVGTLCASDKECSTGICADSSVLTADITGKAGGSVCTQTCCRSDDCPEQFVCFNPGTGGSYCVKKEWIGRTGATGTKKAGEACARGEECRSGECNQRCIDTCCNDGGCAAGTICARTFIAGHDAFGCTPPVGTKDVNTSCNANADCKTNYCWDYAGYGRRCVAPACTSASCGQVTLYDAFGPFLVTLVANNARTANGDRLSACNGAKSAPGDLPVGKTCTLASECRSDRCSTTLGGCTDVCCVDADCGDPSWVCRPIAVFAQNTQIMALRCIPKNR